MGGCCSNEDETKNELKSPIKSNKKGASQQDLSDVEDQAIPDYNSSSKKHQDTLQFGISPNS